MSFLPRSRDHKTAGVVQGVACGGSGLPSRLPASFAPTLGQLSVFPAPLGEAQASPQGWEGGAERPAKAGGRQASAKSAGSKPFPRVLGSNSPTTSSHACAFFGTSTFWRIPQPTSPDLGAVPRPHRLAAQGCPPLDTGQMEAATRTGSQSAEM